MNSMRFTHSNSRRLGFTLIEVVLALGVFLVSVVALVGLLAPMLKSVDEIEKLDEITSVVNTVNAFLQSSPEIAVRTGGLVTKTKFSAIYEAVATGDEATVFVYRYYDDTDPDKAEIRLEVGFSTAEEGIVGQDSIINLGGTNPPDFGQAAGPIYRVVLSASPVIPLQPVALRSDPRDTQTGIYSLLVDLDDYPEGYLAMEARIFAETPPGAGQGSSFDTETRLVELNLKQPDFTFNTAIVR